MSTVDSIVRNVSASGAKLFVAGSLSIPGEFELQTPQKRRTYRARLVWRNSEAMGVEFMAADDKTSTGARLRVVEIENARLKERIRGLNQKLTGLEEE